MFLFRAIRSKEVVKNPSLYPYTIPIAHPFYQLSRGVYTIRIPSDERFTDELTNTFGLTNILVFDQKD